MKMKNCYLTRFMILLTFLVGFTSATWAQERKVTGTVTDAEDGSPLPGVNILLKGSTTGAITDFDGNYSINVSGDAPVLVFSFIGYKTEEVAVGSQTTINLALTVDAQALGEVVVIGYGTQDKKEITSSVTSVSAKDFNQGNVNNPVQLLQGKVPGLSITRPGSNPNGNFAIRLRGISTLGANASPLIIVDGVIGANLQSVDPNDIETIDVLKDGSAAAIYGTRGSSGVILITTKSGKSGKATIDYNGFTAIESVAKTVDVMDADEYRAFPGSTDLLNNTDWFDELTRTGVSHAHNLSVSGGTPSSNYRVSVNYRDQQGVAITTGWKQLNSRINLTQRALNDKVTMRFDVAGTTRQSEFGFDEAFRYATIYNPTAPVRVIPGQTQLPANFANTDFNRLYDGYFQQVLFDYFNPVAILEQNRNEGEFKRINVAGRIDVEPIEDLRLSAFYSLQNESEIFGGYRDKQSFGLGRDRNGFASRNTNNFENQLFELTGTYERKFNDLNVSLLGGYSYQEFNNEGFGASGGNFITDAFQYNNLGAALDFPNGLGGVFSYQNSNLLIAFFGRVNLNYKGIAFISASTRREGSSRFGAENKWGNFPAVSGGVDISKLVDIPSFSSLKLRAGFGRTGNQPSLSYLSLFRFGPSGNFLVNGSFIPGYGPSINPNPNLRWETKDEINVGIDFTALNSKLSGQIDWYTRSTKDFIIEQQVPVPPNLANRTFLNGGEFVNTGLEVALNYEVLNKGDFTWNTSVNMTTLSTEIKDLLLDGVPRLEANVGSPGLNGLNMALVREGDPLGQIWARRYLGVGDNGKWQIEDKDGDGNVSELQDGYVVGSGLPKVIAGWNNSFTYKKFDLNFFFRGTFGHSLVNQFRTFYTAPQAIGSYNLLREAREWQEQGLTDVPQYLDIHVEKADFVTLDNATLGYNFTMPQSSAVKRLRLYASGQNLFYITGYKGVDPEVRYTDSENGVDSGNPLAPGIDRRNTWFRTRTITIGLNVGF